MQQNQRYRFSFSVAFAISPLIQFETSEDGKRLKIRDTASDGYCFSPRFGLSLFFFSSFFNSNAINDVALFSYSLPETHLMMGATRNAQANHTI